MVYRAKWNDKKINGWRSYSNKFVALKYLNNSQNVILEFINEVIIYY